MRIVFDGDIFVHQRFGGVSRYFSRLARELALTDSEVLMMCGLHVNEYVRDLPFARGWRVPEIRRTGMIRSGISRRWQSLMIRRLSSNDDLGLPTVVHKTWYDNDFFDGRVPVVVTVHDLIPELFGKSNRSTVTKKIVCEKATKIIVISETTKTDLLNRYKVPEDRVHVIYHGVDLDRSVGETVPRSADQPLLLFVGARGWYKNFDRLVEAIASSSLLKQNCTLQCCGGGPFTNRELDRIRSLGLVGSFKHCSPSDRELQEFYRRAQILVVPSLYEGFGLPVLEAMAHGCTVACSNQGALPEVAGDAAAFFDPTEPESIAAALERVCFDRTFHAELQQRGLARSKLFRWDACAAATRLVYEESLKKCSSLVGTTARVYMRSA